jgi:conserved repeat domain
MLLPRIAFASTATLVAGVILAACGRDIVAPANVSGSTALAAGGVASGSDLQISGSASTGSPNAGAAFSYTFQIKNSGPDAASDVTFTDTLPAGTGFNYATANGIVFPCAEASMIVTCNLGAISKGSQSVVVVKPRRAGHGGQLQQHRTCCVEQHRSATGE